LYVIGAEGEGMIEDLAALRSEVTVQENTIYDFTKKVSE
jgi:hypothetical protein